MTRDEFWAQGRHFISAIGAMLATLGLLSQVDVDTLLKAFDAINKAYGLLWTAFGLLAPIVAGLIARRSASPAAQLQKALSIDPQIVIKQAVESRPLAAINAVANLEQVAAVVTDNATASAVPSPAVINLEQARVL